MMSFLLIAAPLMAMAGAYLTVLQAGYMAGRASEEQQLGIGIAERQAGDVGSSPLCR